MHYINTGTRISEAAKSLSLLKTKLLPSKMSGTSGAGAGKAPSSGGTGSGSSKGGG